MYRRNINIKTKCGQQTGKALSNHESFSPSQSHETVTLNCFKVHVLFSLMFSLHVSNGLILSTSFSLSSNLAYSPAVPSMTSLIRETWSTKNGDHSLPENLNEGPPWNLHWPLFQTANGVIDAFSLTIQITWKAAFDFLFITGLPLFRDAFPRKLSHCW